MAFTGDTWTSDVAQIALIWQGSSDAAARFQSVATTHWELVVARVPGRPTAVTVRGPETRVTAADLPAGGEWWGIRFALGSYLPQLPAPALVDTGIELLEPGTRSLWWPGGRLPLPDPDDAEAFVRRLIRDETGYFDQSHLTHSLKRWFGLTPAQVTGPADEVLGR